MNNGTGHNLFTAEEMVWPDTPEEYYPEIRAQLWRKFSKVLSDVGNAAPCALLFSWEITYHHRDGGIERRPGFEVDSNLLRRAAHFVIRLSITV